MNDRTCVYEIANPNSLILHMESFIKWKDCPWSCTTPAVRDDPVMELQSEYWKGCETCTFWFIMMYFKSPSLQRCIDKVLMVEVFGGNSDSLNKSPDINRWTHFSSNLVAKITLNPRIAASFFRQFSWVNSNYGSLTHFSSLSLNRLQNTRLPSKCLVEWLSTDMAWHSFC